MALLGTSSGEIAPTSKAIIGRAAPNHLTGDRNSNLPCATRFRATGSWSQNQDRWL